MSADVDFYFDFSSPYGYIASRLIDDLALRYGRGVEWHPIMLGAAMKKTGSQPLVHIPIKGDYVRHDLLRTARHLDIPFLIPEPFPIKTLAAARAFYWFKRDNVRLAHSFAKDIFYAYFGEGQDVSLPEVVANIASPLGIDGDTLKAAIVDPTIKELLKNKTDAAIGKGVFGSPFICVDGESFWGADRLRDIEEWLNNGSKPGNCF